MKLFSALLIAIGIHLGLAALLVFYFDLGLNSEKIAKLDVSSVELSLSDKESESAAPNDSMPTIKEEARSIVEKVVSPVFEKGDIEIAGTPPEIAPLVMPEVEVVVAPKMETPKPLEAVAKSEQNNVREAPQQARVEAKQNPKRPIKPKYPKLARERGEEGAIRLKLGINARGLVENIEILSSTGFKLLDEAAIKAVKAAKFIPAHIDGEAVFSTSEIKLEFKLK